MMTSKEILEKYINFYKQRGHALVPNVSLVPENDPTLLYVNSGMFPLVPYLTGQPHPQGTRLVNVQRCLRFFEDLENVGVTNRHTTAFHMLGNWSLNDYFKEEQLNWAYEFLIEELKLDPNKMYASVFMGDQYAPKDEEAISIIKNIYKKYGIDAKENERIFAYGRKDNWWQRGEAVGELGGPDSEIFYYIGKDGNGFGQNPEANQDEFLEIGNSVFMQYIRNEDLGWSELPQKNVDFGGGLERFALVVQNKSDIYLTDNFYPIIEKIQELSTKEYGENDETKRAMGILADHMRAATFLAMDGVIPSNKDQGYILRRLLRRMVRAGRTLGINEKVSVNLVEVIVNNFSWIYPALTDKKNDITKTFNEEENKFRIILEKGTRLADKELATFKGNEKQLAEIAFNLYQSSGYPEEMLFEDVKEKLLPIDEKQFYEEYNKLVTEHRNLSRSGAEQKFKGGLADTNEETVKYHTATHLLHWALRETVGDKVSQMGSNITGERLRFDFPHDERLSDEDIAKVEKLFNEKVDQALPVDFVMLPKTEAEKLGAVAAFGEKYGDTVKVYFMGNSLEEAFSKEFCGGPHVSNTNQLQPITIFKQKSIGKGIIRIYSKWRE